MDEKKEKEEAATIDDVILKLGSFGRYQKKVFFLMCLLPMTVSIQVLMTVFTLATPEHRCAVPGMENDTYEVQSPAHAALLNASIPWTTDDDDVPMRSECDLYRKQNFSADAFTNRSTVSCSKWVYDRSTFDSTFTEEAGLVCDKKEYHATADMLYMVGVLVGSLLIGLYSDRFGRKIALMTALAVHVGCAIGTAFVRSYTAFVVLRFFIGIGNMSVFLVCYVLGLELVGSSYRTMAGSVIQMFWPIGLFLQTGIAYFIRDWDTLQLALSCPPVLFFLYFWLVKESPRWLASRGRNEDANKILQEVARVNGRPAPPPLKGGGEGEVKRESALKMFTNPRSLVRIIIIYINWVVVTMVYYGLSLNVGSLGGSIYLNNFLSSLAELIGYIIALFGLDRLGRKRMHCGAMILGGLACLASMFPVMYGDDSLDWVIIVLSNLGKLGASAGFSIIYLFSAELFPTVARNSLLGSASMIARVGGIVSPYIAQLNDIVGGKLGVALPLVVFGGAALGAGLLALLLPETLHQPLPETIEDAINFGTKKQKTKEFEKEFPAQYDNKTFEIDELNRRMSRS